MNSKNNEELEAGIGEANIGEASIVIESYTHGEGGDFGRFRDVLQAATQMAKAHGNACVLVTDTHGDDELLELLEREFPEVERVEALGMSYDEAKTKAAEQSQSRFVLYLDGDCLPQQGWLDAHLEVLRDEKTHASGGFTRYDGGFFAAVCSVMDFGFLLPRGQRILPCYASNNSGFRRSTLLQSPVPSGPMRCRCYAHAQLLKRLKTPVRMVPNAVVLHEVQPFYVERFRQGYDAVAACWTNPKLPETPWLRLGPLAAMPLYARNVLLDWRRLQNGRRDLGLKSWQITPALALYPFLRLVDFAGMLSALTKPRPQTESCEV